MKSKFVEQLSFVLCLLWCNYLRPFSTDSFQMSVVRCLRPQAMNKKGIFQLSTNFSLTLDPMGITIPKRYCSLKLLLKLYKFVLNFLLNGLHQSIFLGIWKFEALNFKLFVSFSFILKPIGVGFSKWYCFKSLRIIANFDWNYFSK